jgi:hypothetical protein
MALALGVGQNLINLFQAQIIIAAAQVVQNYSLPIVPDLRH